MVQEPIYAKCDICGNEESPLWNDEGSKIVYCTDCYLRENGYDPDEVGKRFSELARHTFADFINEQFMPNQEGRCNSVTCTLGYAAQRRIEVMSFVHGGQYDGPKWSYCPWCGRPLETAVSSSDHYRESPPVEVPTGS